MIIFVNLLSENIKSPFFEPSTCEIECPREKLEITIMSFTPEEAGSLVERLRAEREEAERKEAERIEAERREAERRAEAARLASSQSSGSTYYTPGDFKQRGRISWGGWSWTWYSERVLPGYGLHIPGRYTDHQGYVRDGSGYLCLASDDLPQGTVVDTPFGSRGIVYDCGCGYGTLDVYVGW